MSDDRFKPYIACAVSGAPLSGADMRAAMDLLLEGAATPAQAGAFLAALAVRGETPEEIAAAAAALRARADSIAAPAGAIDVCGTGGSGLKTLNISTAVAFVVAACGVPVAKHGNRAVSSASGSSDVLAALGVNLHAPLPVVERCLNETGVAFLFAPRHHPAVRHVGPVRAELGVRTLFNILGPLANPAGARRQIMGVYAAALCAPLAEALGRLGAERAWVVHGEDGLDELTVTGESHVAAFEDGAVKSFRIKPEDAGLARSNLSEIAGAGPEENAVALQALLGGKTGPYRDIVLLNAAAALVVAGAADTLAEGAQTGASAIDDGRAAARLEALVRATNG